MKAIEYLHKRQSAWLKLEQFCRRLERGPRRLTAAELIEFARLYRATCADLALADAHQLPEPTVRYLHQLVGRAHNLLYRSRFFRFREWVQEILFRLPRRLFRDPYLRVAALLFYGLFVFSFVLGLVHPRSAETLLGRETVEGLEQMYETRRDRDLADSASATGYYIRHNTGIGLECFALGLVLGVGGLFALVYNAVVLGVIFGYMNTTPMAPNFNDFVTAHAPFELTAIVLSAAAGMRLGFAFLIPGGKTRSAALQEAGRRALPVMMLAALLFWAAAVIEGYVSPSQLPYMAKATVAGVSALLLTFYLVVLGSAGAPAGEDTSERERSWQEILRGEETTVPVS